MKLICHVEIKLPEILNRVVKVSLVIKHLEL